MNQGQKFPELFVAGDWVQMNACLNYSGVPARYIDGYLRAADRLVEHVAESNRDHDILVYPISFLYRQHIELTLKQIIVAGKELLDEGFDHPLTHNLLDLWGIAKGLVRKIWKDRNDPDEFSLIDHFLSEFSSVDRDSMAFRYPQTRTGEHSLPDIYHINLYHLAECVHSSTAFLDGTASAISGFVNWKRESGWELEKERSGLPWWNK